MNKLITFFKSIFSNKYTIKTNDLLPVTLSHCLMVLELDRRNYRNCNESIQRLMERLSYRRALKVNGYNV
jgi:hypothetical protein